MRILSILRRGTRRCVDLCFLHRIPRRSFRHVLAPAFLYETKEDDPEREHLAASTLIEEPAYDLIHRTVELITEIMSGISIWTVDGLKKVAYPPEAIWEAGSQLDHPS